MAIARMRRLMPLLPAGTARCPLRGSNSPSTTRPRSLHGVPKVRSPASRLLRGAATSCQFLAALCFAWRYLGASAFRPRSAADAWPTDHPGVCCTGCSCSGRLRSDGHPPPRKTRFRQCRPVRG